MLQVSHVINFDIDHVTLFLFDSSGQASAACSTGDIRLTHTNSDGTVGRVQVCKYNLWFLISDNQWDDQDAKVACVQLGFALEG